MTRAPRPLATSPASLASRLRVEPRVRDAIAPQRVGLTSVPVKPVNSDKVDIAWITDDGERVSELQQDHSYFAHLSIYWFALRYCTGKTVLDAGSGTGYGSAYLAEHGAREVHGIDVSEKAVDYSEATFRLPNLSYRRMDLQEISGFPNHHFDVIFSSNVFEHVPDVTLLMFRARELVRSDG